MPTYSSPLWPQTGTWWSSSRTSLAAPDCRLHLILIGLCLVLEGVHLFLVSLYRGEASVASRQAFISSQASCLAFMDSKDRRSVGKSLLVSSTHLGPKTWFLLLSGSCRFVDVGRFLWRKNGTVVYDCCWPSTAQSLIPESRRTQDHILLSQIRDPQLGGPGPRIYIPQEQGGLVIPPGTGFNSHRLLRLAGLRWRYSTPPPQGILLARIVILYDWRFTANQFVLATSPLRLTTSNFIFQLNSCGYIPYVTYSDERMGLSFTIAAGLASAVIFGSESRWTHDTILLYQIRDSPNLEGQVLVFVSARNRVARLFPQALGSLCIAF
jgi:hypothetical protein